MITIETSLEAFERMELIRLVEDALAEDFRKNKIFSFIHFANGQEAIAVGMAMGVQPQDKFFGTHRSHHIYLAKGGDLYRMLCEIYGKQDGCGKGRSGSMHLLDRSVGFEGSTPILGSVAAIAVGAAFAKKIQKKDEVIVVFLGDGATEEGIFYESLNLAALFQLPIIFVVEDNLFAVNSPATARRHEYYSLRKVAEGLRVQYTQVDGNSFEAVYTKAKYARGNAIKGCPEIIHAVTFRDMGHSGPVRDESVRIVDTEEVRRQQDPIKRMVEALSTRCAPHVPLTIRDRVYERVHSTLVRAKAAEDARSY